MNRRSFSCLFLNCLTASAAPVPPPTLAADARRYLDPLTENIVFRLTDPRYTSVLPPSSARPVPARGNALYFATDRTGTMQAVRLDLKTLQPRLLTRASQLDPATLSILPGERGLLYQDQDALHWWTPRASRVLTQANRLRTAPVSTADGGLIAFSEEQGERSRLRLIRLNSAGAERAPFELPAPIDGLAFRSKSADLLLSGPAGAFLLAEGASEIRPIPLRPDAAAVRWSADGASLLYLDVPREKGRLVSIRNYDLSTGRDELVTKTSQFASFGSNQDDSVFVGASRSKAQPALVLLLRIGRELTLCEHAARQARDVKPQFSPNSQRVFFQSEREGRPVIYSMVVDQLVAETEEG